LRTITFAPSRSRSAPSITTFSPSSNPLKIAVRPDSAGPIFTGVSGRVGVAIMELAGGPQAGTGRPVERVAQVAVGLADPDDPPGDRAWPLAASLLRVLNPNTGTAPLFGSMADAQPVLSACAMALCENRKKQAVAVQAAG